MRRRHRARRCIARTARCWRAPTRRQRPAARPPAAPRCRGRRSHRRTHQPAPRPAPRNSSRWRSSATCRASSRRSRASRAKRLRSPCKPHLPIHRRCRPPHRPARRRAARCRAWTCSRRTWWWCSLHSAASPRGRRRASMAAPPATSPRGSTSPPTSSCGCVQRLADTSLLQQCLLTATRMLGANVARRACNPIASTSVVPRAGHVAHAGAREPQQSVARHHRRHVVHAAAALLHGRPALRGRRGRGLLPRRPPPLRRRARAHAPAPLPQGRAGRLLPAAPPQAARDGGAAARRPHVGARSFRGARQRRAAHGGPLRQLRLRPAGGERV